MKSERFKELAKAVPHGSVPWFDLLDGSGLLAAWFASDLLDVREYAVWLCSPTEVVKARGNKIASLIEPLIKKRGADVPELKRLFRFADFGTSSEMCRIFLDLIAMGAFDGDAQHWQSHLHGFAKVNPTAGAKILGRAFDRALILAKEQRANSPFDGRESFYGMDIPQELVVDSARLDPGTFSEEIIPRIASLLAANETIAKDGDILDKVWLFRAFGMIESFKDQVLSSAAGALALLSAKDSPRMDMIIAPFEQMPHQNMAYLLLTGWAGNAPIYANRIIDYLLADSRRLDIGYAMWDSGNGISAITRAAISAAGPHCSDERFGRIEDLIREYYPHSERDDLKGRGYHQYLLLCALPRERLSAVTITRLQELERKFPGIEAGGPYLSDSDGFVRSPIGKESAERMSDDQWLNAMRTHDSEEGKRRRREDFLVGGAHQLSGVLEHLAREDKPRFAKLALRMDVQILPAYFEALLRGLSGQAERNHPVASQPVVPESFLPDDEFETFLLHVYGVAGDKIGRWICSAIGARANHKLSTPLLDIVATYATTATDPEFDSWTRSDGSGELYGGDALTEGINTTRGAAAYAITAFLFADRDRMPRFETAIASLVNDKSVAVRAVAIECLVAMLNFDRNRAVELFLTAVKCDDAILRTHSVRSFVHYTVFSHYHKIREFLFRMLASPVTDVRKVAAQNIAVAAFSLSNAVEDLRKVADGDEYCRSGIASVDATNFSVDECREVSRSRLMAFFDDPSKVVRTSAAKVIQKMGAKLLVTENELLDAFIASRSFNEHVSTLIYLLKETVELLPEIVCHIGERAAELHEKGQAEAQWWTHDAGALVLRLYDQTRDPGLQKRCLDLIDQMVEYNFGNIDAGLRQVERD
jgi:hypothetical protein